MDAASAPFAAGALSSADVYRALAAVQDGRIDQAQEVFALSDDDQRRPTGFIRDEIKDNDTAKLLIATYVWHEHAEQADDDVMRRWELDFAKATLEHIIPQRPAANTNWLRDFSNDFRRAYTYRLGNMTLLTGSKNGRARNHGFERKKPVYKKTLLPLTLELATLDAITPARIEERHERIVQGILMALGL